METRKGGHQNNKKTTGRMQEFFKEHIFSQLLKHFAEKDELAKLIKMYS